MTSCALAISASMSRSPESTLYCGYCGVIASLGSSGFSDASSHRPPTPRDMISCLGSISPSRVASSRNGMFNALGRFCQLQHHCTLMA